MSALSTSQDLSQIPGNGVAQCGTDEATAVNHAILGKFLNSLALIWHLWTVERLGLPHRVVVRVG